MTSTPLPTIRHLPPPGNDGSPALTAYSIRLSSHIVSHLKASAPTYAPKLVVRDGRFFLKVSPDTEYPLTQVPENLTVDIYDLGASEPRYNGRIESRLTVNTECAPPRQYSNRKLVINEASEDRNTVLQKMLLFMALGPSSLSNLCSHIHLKEDDPFITQYLQKYNPNDQFIKDDVFPYTPHDIRDTYILKDRAYKEIRVYANSDAAGVLSPSQKTLIVHNLNRALTRLGFLDTHPIRNKLTSATAGATSSTPNSPANGNGTSMASSGALKSSLNGSSTSSALGGGLGLLKSKKEVSPRKKHSSSTASTSASGSTPASVPPRPLTPNLNTPPPTGNSSVASSASSQLSRKRIRTMSSASSSSSEDERVKRVRADSAIAGTSISSSTTSPSSLDDDASVGQDEKKPNYYATILDRFHRTYSQYQALYTQLEQSSNGAAGGSSTPMSMAASASSSSPSAPISAETKRSLVRLLELHNSLSLWKRMLWDHEKDKQKSKDIKNLTKHKKSASLSGTQTNGNGSLTPASATPSASTPTTSSTSASALSAMTANSGLSVRSSYSVKAHSASPGLPPTVKRSRITPKMSLDY